MAHGKSTVVKAISGVQTVRFKNELIRNITIKLGYANAKVSKGMSSKLSRWLTGSRSGLCIENRLEADGTVYQLQVEC